MHLPGLDTSLSSGQVGIQQFLRGSGHPIGARAVSWEGTQPGELRARPPPGLWILAALGQQRRRGAEAAVHLPRDTCM